VKKIAVVTGANRGLGLATAEALAVAQFKVLMVGRDEAKLKKAAQPMVAKGLDVETYVADVSSSMQIDKLAFEISQKHSAIDVLINNAGVFIDPAEPMNPGPASIALVPVETIEKSFHINTVGPLLVTRALLPLLQKSRAGRIVNVSSGMGQLSEMEGFFPAYRLSKTALNAVTKIFAEELKETSIKVNAVCPGWVKTDMGGPHAERSLSEGIRGIVWAATLSDTGPTGGFFRDGEKLDW